MPELPEVETIRLKLLKELKDIEIKKVEVYYNNIVETPLNEFIKYFENKKIIDIKRIGKWLIFEFDDKYLLSHLRMEGKYIIREESENLKHEHIVFKLSNGKDLIYKDVRKFGKMYLINKEDLYKVKPLDKIGYEPFDKRLTIDYLIQKFKNKSLPIKTVLLDQNIITGIGNIYADEILFLSNINPYKKAKELNKEDLDNIIKNSITVLNKAISHGGSTIRSYVSLGEKGSFQDELYVYGKKDKKCIKCNDIIIKTTINGRGTHYCPTCQKEN